MSTNSSLLEFLNTLEISEEIEDNANFEWYVGVTTALIAGICINLGSNLVKLGHIRNERREYSQLPASPNEESGNRCIRYLRITWPWWFGLFLFAVGNLSNFGAASFTPATTLAALGSVQLVTNVIFATMVLSERPTWRIGLGTSVVVAGNVLVVFSSRRRSQTYDAHQLRLLFFSPAHAIYILSATLVAPAAYLLFLRAQTIIKTTPTPDVPTYIWKITPLLYALHAALPGTQAVVMSKAIALLLKCSLVEHQEQLSSWFSYVILLLLIMSGFFWLRCMNTALQLFPSLVIIPILQINWILFSVVGGGIYFQEFSDLSRHEIAGFVCGLMLLFLGVYFLTPGISMDDNIDEGSPEGFTAVTIEGSDDESDRGVYSHRRCVRLSASTSFSSLQAFTGALYVPARRASEITNEFNSSCPVRSPTLENT